MRKLFFLIWLYIKEFLGTGVTFLKGGNLCLICGAYCGSIYLCRNCVKKHFSLKRIFQYKRCEICSKELISTKSICMECRSERVLFHTDSVFSLYPYRLWNKEIVFMWKSQNIRSFSFFFGKILEKVLKEKKISLIVPVPPRPGKIIEKGWEQIDELCNILEYRFNFNILRILKRKSVLQQKKFKREQRLESTNQAYFLEENRIIQRELKKNGGTIPKEVCLLDDVCTTGSTIETCAKLLKEVGIDKVHVITLFKVD